MEQSIQVTMQAQAAFENELLAKQNVVGVAVGPKESEGVLTGEMAVVVLVKEKVPLQALSASEVIPKHIDGVRTDVMAVGDLRALQSPSPRGRFRPTIPSGVSIGHFRVTAGTLGVMVRDKNTGERFILSNNHVLANSNDAQTNDGIVQPGTADGGIAASDIVAQLASFIPLRYVGDPPTPTPATPTPPDPTPDPSPNPDPTPDPNPNPNPNPPGGCLPTLVGFINFIAALTGSHTRLTTAAAQALSAQTAGQPVMPAPVPAPVIIRAQNVDNVVDAALARPLDPAMFTDEILGIGTISGTMAPTLGQQVRKSGRTTGLTFGRVTLLNATVNVGYNTVHGDRTARFTGQVITEAMSQGGDSGSLVVNASDNRAVGLLFAGSPLATIFTPIDVVLAALNITI